MAWLRIDDGFAQHPKVVAMTPRDRWTWLEILCYCARYRTDGSVPASVREVVRGATSAFLEHAETLGLLDEEGPAQYRVHDWDDYNGRDPKIVATERQRRYRRRDTDVTDAVTPPLQERDKRRDKSVTRAQPRARVPVPNPTPSPTPEGSNRSEDQTVRPSVDASYETRNGRTDPEGTDDDPEPGTDAYNLIHTPILKDMPA